MNDIGDDIRFRASYPHRYTSELIGYVGVEENTFFNEDYGWLIETENGLYSPTFGLVNI